MIVYCAGRCRAPLGVAQEIKKGRLVLGDTTNAVYALQPSRDVVGIGAAEGAGGDLSCRACSSPVGRVVDGVCAFRLSAARVAAPPAGAGDVAAREAEDRLMSRVERCVRARIDAEPRVRESPRLMMLAAAMCRLLRVFEGGAPWAVEAHGKDGAQMVTFSLVDGKPAVIDTCEDGLWVAGAELCASGTGATLPFGDVMNVWYKFVVFRSRGAARVDKLLQSVGIEPAEPLGELLEHRICSAFKLSTKP